MSLRDFRASARFAFMVSLQQQAPDIYFTVVLCFCIKHVTVYDLSKRCYGLLFLLRNVSI